MTYIKQYLRLLTSSLIAFIGIGYGIDLLAEYINVDVWKLAVLVCLAFVVELYVVRFID